MALVGEETITYNDIMGNSHEVPILSRKPADSKRPKFRLYFGAGLKAPVVCQILAHTGAEVRIASPATDYEK